MDLFKQVFNNVILNEGGYVNDPDDNGGETYMGIARKFHPNSIMWKYVDEYKKKGLKNMTYALKKDIRITNVVEAIYKKDYWFKLRLNELNNVELAQQIFDHAVNAGTVAAVRLAQRIVNVPETGRLSNALINRLNSDYARRVQND